MVARRRRSGMVWRPNQYKIKGKLHPKPPGRMNHYEPWESHPDWGLFTGTGPTPTIFHPPNNSVENTATIPAGSWYSILNSQIGQIENFEMSCIMDYEGMGVAYENYPMAKGVDENNFVGATSYNSQIMLYEKVGGAWHNLNVNVSAAGTKGKEIKIIVIGNQITLFVDHVEIGTATHGVPGLAYVGAMVRRHPIVGPMWHNIKIKVLDVVNEPVTYFGTYVTNNSEVVTHG
jgi:hypothetical protein